MDTPEIDEKAKLLQTISELTTKATTRKDRKATLETENKALKESFEIVQASLREIEINVPVRTLAAAISGTPKLFMLEVARVGYSVEKLDGKLAVMKGGKEVEGVDFAIDEVTQLLTKTDDPDGLHKNFRSLITVSKASGGGAIGQNSSGFSQVENKPTKPSH